MPAPWKEKRKAERRARISAGETELQRKKLSFHRGDTVNFHPNRKDYHERNFLADYVLKGWTPAAPVIGRGTKVTAFGSCFAANITRHLSSIGYNLSSDRDPGIYISRLGDGMVNTASILGQFEWTLEGKEMPVNLWHGQKAEGYGYDADIRRRTRDIFLGTEFFIITLGLSEVWYDAQSGGTFWRAVPENVFDPARHKFRVLSVAETKADIAAIHALIRKHVPGARVLFTVSPIPLAATFREVSCLTANTASKAIIRAALDEFLRENEGELNESLFYFPSMELVQLGFVDPWGKDLRHPHSYVLETVMNVFEAVYCDSPTTLADASRMLEMFRIKNIREIARRRSDEIEEDALLDEAKQVTRAAKKARRLEKARQANLAVAGPEQDAVRRERRLQQHAETEGGGLDEAAE